ALPRKGLRNLPLDARDLAPERFWPRPQDHGSEEPLGARFRQIKSSAQSDFLSPDQTERSGFRESGRSHAAVHVEPGRPRGSDHGLVEPDRRTGHEWAGAIGGAEEARLVSGRR